jgi:hypothetical protein
VHRDFLITLYISLDSRKILMLNIGIDTGGEEEGALKLQATYEEKKTMNGCDMGLRFS